MKKLHREKFGGFSYVFVVSFPWILVGQTQCGRRRLRVADGSVQGVMELKIGWSVLDAGNHPKYSETL